MLTVPFPVVLGATTIGMAAENGALLVKDLAGLGPVCDKLEGELQGFLCNNQMAEMCNGQAGRCRVYAIVTQRTEMQVPYW